MALKAGFLGHRFMGRAHANALARLPMFFPEAPPVDRHVLIGRDEAALEENADQLGFTTTSTDWRDAIDDIDVLYNLGPNYLHVEPSVAALEAGIHVMCEKPLAATLEGAQSMAAAAESSDAVTATAFNYRFVPAIRYAKRLVDDGELGEIHHFRGRYMQDWLVDPDAPWSWRNDEELAGSGALGDLGAHTVDLARFLLGDRAGGFERINGQLQTFVDERPTPDGDERRPVTVDDAYTAQGEFENGALATFEGSRFATGHKNDHSITIHGSDGSLRFSLERLNELEVLTGDSRGYETVMVTDPDDPYIERWWPPGHVVGWEHTFIHENFEFLTAIDEGSSYAPDFADGLAVQHVLDGIDTSDARGEWVDL